MANFTKAKNAAKRPALPKPAKEKKPVAKKYDNASPKAAAALKPEKPKKATKAQRMNALDDKASEVMTQFRRFKLAESSWDAAHAEAGSAKKEMELQQEKLNALIQEMSDISSGKTKLLPFTHSVPTGGAPQPATPAVSTAEDVGAKKPLTTLIAKNLKAACPAKYREGIGLSEKQIDKLEEIIGGNTIGQLEKFQRENSFDWNRKMKGFGETGVDKLQDAMSVLRSAFPIPSPDDKAAPPTPAESSANAASASNGKAASSPITEAFTAGQEACRGGKELKHCPHPSATPLALKWNEGFEAEKSAKAAADNKPTLSEADKDKLRKANEAAATKA